MHVDLITLNLRNVLFFQFLVIFVLAGTAPVVQQELQRIWKTLTTPLRPKKPAVTNHKSNKFWEIDMTNFEP